MQHTERAKFARELEQTREIIKALRVLSRAHADLREQSYLAIRDSERALLDCRAALFGGALLGADLRRE